MILPLSWAQLGTLAHIIYDPRLLTNNNLTLMHCDFFDNTPGLTTLHIENNQIRAIPMTQNKIANPATAAGNPLICST